MLVDLIRRHSSQETSQPVQDVRLLNTPLTEEDDMCDQHNCPNGTPAEHGWILVRCGEDPGELIEKIKRLESIIQSAISWIDENTPWWKFGCSLPMELQEDFKRLRKEAGMKDSEPVAQIELHELRETNKSLRAYVGTNDLRSDYRSADDMRETIEKLQSDQKDLLDMLTDVCLEEHQGEVPEMGVPDWLTMAKSRADAKAGRGSSIEDVVAELASDSEPVPPEEEDGSEYELKWNDDGTLDGMKKTEPVAPAEYQPDHATPPGETIKEMMGSHEMTIAEQIAADLAKVFSYPASFWLNLQSNYRRTLARLAEKEGEHKPIVTESETTGDEALLVLDDSGRDVSFWKNAGDVHMSLEEVVSAWLAAGFGVSRVGRRENT